MSAATPAGLQARDARGAALGVPIGVLLGVLLGVAVLASAQPGRAQPVPAADLVVAAVDVSGLRGDWQRLAVSGTVAVELRNLGAADVTQAFEVRLFDDLDRDGRFDEASDRGLAMARHEAGLAAGVSARLSIPLDAPVRFRDVPLLAWADSAEVVAESDEGNNVGSSAEVCALRPPEGAFDPVLEWGWSGSAVEPASHHVMGAPLVVDLDGDGVPEVVFGSFAAEGPSARTMDVDGHLRALDGRGGAERFTVVDPRYDIRATASLAAGDIDGDGRPEILAVHEDGERILAFEHDGSPKWRSAPTGLVLNRGAPALANLDGVEPPEIVIGGTVLDAAGRIRWQGRAGQGENRAGYGMVSSVADLDGDGRLEVVAGNTAYRADGSLLWQAGAPDGFTAVADFDADGAPEVVLVAKGAVWLLDAAGRALWGPVRTGARDEESDGGPPTVADFDGDGAPEIGFAERRRYTVLDTDGRVLWWRPTEDLSSGVTGSTAFDFEGDGRMEVVYGDERALYVFDGRDGAVRWQTASTSRTTMELPVVADVDADGEAEIVKVSNDYAVPGGGTRGIQVFGDRAGRWVPTRPLWNQHAYHVTNVEDDGTIPLREAPSWTAHNSYRVNLPRGRNPLAAPDATAAFLRFDLAAWPAEVGLTARIGSAGAQAIAAGTWIAFYREEQGLRSLLGRVALPRALAPGDAEDVTLRWTGPAARPGEILVVADDDGQAGGRIRECDETNNAHAARFEPPPPTRTPTATSTATRTATASPTLSPAPTASATSTPSATPSPRPTPRPGPLYLPLALREEWKPRTQRADVVLVIDASSSMAGPKLAAAKAAAAGFVDLLALPEDQVAVVAFQDRARPRTGLSGDAGALQRAIAGIESSPGTRIDEGLRWAIDELAGPRRRAGNLPVIVLLTDGRQAIAPAEPPRLAALARAAGVRIYAIGLGGDVDEAYLLDLAGHPGRSYLAPSARDLAAIYREIAVNLPCPAERFWGRRC